MPVSSQNSRCAAARASSPGSMTPLGMVAEFDELHELAVGRSASDDEAFFFHLRPVVQIELVAMAMAFSDLGLAVDLVCASPFLDVGRPGAETHGGAFVGHVALRFE